MAIHNLIFDDKEANPISFVSYHNLTSCFELRYIIPGETKRKQKIEIQKVDIGNLHFEKDKDEFVLYLKLEIMEIEKIDTKFQKLKRTEQLKKLFGADLIYSNCCRPFVERLSQSSCIVLSILYF